MLLVTQEVADKFIVKFFLRGGMSHQQHFGADPNHDPDRGVLNRFITTAA